jgi:hypothetical protein
VRKSLLNIDEIKRAISFDQPYLSVVEAGERFQIFGKFVVAPTSHAAAEGAIDQFDVSILVAKNFPRTEPEVFETGNRIPREIDRHCNPNGTCCTGVWEEWIAMNERPSIDTFLEGPVRNFFLSQMSFEIHKCWPFGERSHGDAGIREACADMLGIKNDEKLILRYLLVLAGHWPKGHWQCPCGGGQRIRDCHRDELMAMHSKMPPHIARGLFNKLRQKKRRQSNANR